MVLELKIRKVGNSLGVILPKQALNYLRVEEGDTVSVTEGADGGLRISQHKPEVARQLTVAQDVLKRYRNTVRELAK
jgi:putative addiction module antidote